MDKIKEAFSCLVTILLLPSLIVFVPLMLLICWALGEYRKNDPIEIEVEYAKKQYEEENNYQ